MDWFETAMKIIVVIGSLGVVSVVLSLGRLGRRLTGGRRSAAREWLLDPTGRRDPAADAELAELRQTVEGLSGDVAELQERMDFAERMLAQQREQKALPDR